eukprot:2705795-Pyramimonas_sp.AAC.1
MLASVAPEQYGTVGPYQKDPRYGCKGHGRPCRSFSSGARPTKVAKDGPRRQGGKGTLGKVAHPYHAGWPWTFRLHYAVYVMQAMWCKLYGASLRFRLWCNLDGPPKAQ